MAATANFGYLGVDFFFVLSGFIIYYTTAQLPPTAANGWAFARKRLTRTFVPYLPIGLGLAAAYIAIPSLSASDRSWSWFATLTLLPSWQPPALSVAWTLQHEMVFYLLFAMMFFARAIWLGTALWSAAIVAAILARQDLSGPLQFLLAPINLEFAFGMLAAHHVLTGRRMSLAVILGGLAFPLLPFAAGGALRPLSPLVGLAIAFGVIGVCQFEAAGRLRVAAWLVLLGNASYAIYLVHGPLLSVLTRSLAKVPGIAVWWIAGPLAVAICVFAGCAYHLLYERHASRFVRPRKTALRSATAV